MQNFPEENHFAGLDYYDLPGGEVETHVLVGPRSAHITGFVVNGRI